jgi:hypothetical protein
VGKAVLKKKHLETVHESVQPSTTTPETVPEVLETIRETTGTIPETASGTPETAVGTATETPEPLLKPLLEQLLEPLETTENRR